MFYYKNRETGEVRGFYCVNSPATMAKEEKEKWTFQYAK